MVFFSKVREIILIFIKMRWQSNMTTEDNCNQSSIETEVTAASRGQKFAHFYEAEISLAWLLISSWALCHLFRPLHEYRAVLLHKLQKFQPQDKDKASSMPGSRISIPPESSWLQIYGSNCRRVFHRNYVFMNIASAIISSMRSKWNIFHRQFKVL